MNLVEQLIQDPAERREATKQFFVEVELQLATSRYDNSTSVSQLVEQLLIDEDAALHVQRLRHEAREIHDRILHRDDVDRMSVGELQSIVNRLHSLRDDCYHEPVLADLVRFCIMVIPRIEHEIQKRQQQQHQHAA
jgi:hypothetical protein